MEENWRNVSIDNYIWLRSIDFHSEVSYQEPNIESSEHIIIWKARVEYMYSN